MQATIFKADSFADVAVAEDDPLGAGQLVEAAGASGVVLVGADADLGAEAELAAVVEPGAGIVQNHGAVHLVLELRRSLRVSGDDGVRMP